MDGCESWTIKKAERRRTDAFELWCWRRLFKESLALQGDQTSQSILEIKPGKSTPEYSLEGLTLKLHTLAT